MNNLNKASKTELQRIVDQIERLDEERKGIVGDIKDKFDEAKSKGFDVKILRRVLAIRKKKQADAQEEQELIDTYLNALGWDTTPLGAGRVLEAAE